MDELLRELREEGRLDSVGSFTLDFKRGFEKLRKFQSEPDQFAVQLVAAAHARGAERIELRCLEKDFGLAFRGPGYSWEELQSLFQLEQPSHSVFRLNLALLACLGLDPDVIHMDTWSGSRGLRMTIRGNQLDVHALSQKSEPDTTNLWMTLSWRNSELPTPEARAVVERCGLCPGLVLNGRPVRHGAVPIGTRGNVSLWPEVPGVAGKPDAAYYYDSKPGTTIVVHGVSFPGPAWPVTNGGVAIWCDELGTDLSFRKLREDEKVPKLVEAAYLGLNELLPAILERARPEPALRAWALVQLSSPALDRAKLSLLRWDLNDTQAAVDALAEARQGLSDPELIATWESTCQTWLDRLVARLRCDLQTPFDCEELAGLWARVQQLPLSPVQRALAESQWRTLVQLVWNLEEAAQFSPLANWAIGNVQHAQEQLGDHPLVHLARGDFERAEQGLTDLPAWHARCRRLRGLEPERLPDAAQTFQVEWVVRQLLQKPEKPSRLRALGPMLKFFRDCADERLLHSLAERERERHGRALEGGPSDPSPKALQEVLASGWQLERKGDLASAEKRYLGLLYYSRVTQPTHPVTRLLAIWMGHFYLEHGQLEEGIRHLIWGELPDLAR